MGLAWICPPCGDEKEGSWTESVVLTQAQSQPPVGAFREAFVIFSINF